MSKLIDFFSYLSSFITPWLSEISVAIIACVLVLFGGAINRFLRHYLANRGFVVRTFIFVIVNAFGYGLMIIKLSPLLAVYMAKLPTYWLLPLVLAIFFIIGGWAQRNRQV